MKKLIYVLIILSCVLKTLKAQDAVHEKLKEEIIKDWVKAKEHTQSFLSAMPADKYDWQPTKDVRSFAKQMLHLTYINIGWVSIGTTGQINSPFKIKPGTQLEDMVPQTKDSVAFYTLASYDFAIEKLKKMDASKLFEVSRGDATKLTWINRAFAHQTHQRAVCVTYFRLLGIVPPHTL